MSDDELRAEVASIVRRELEAVARMIEAEPVSWPEDVRRFQELAERVRARAARLAPPRRSRP